MALKNFFYIEMSNGKKITKRLIEKKDNDCFWMETFFVWRVTYICVHVTQAQFLPTSSKHVSPGMRFLGLGIGGLSHQSCMSLHMGTNNIVGGSNNLPFCVTRRQHSSMYLTLLPTVCYSKLLLALDPSLFYYHDYTMYSRTRGA